MADSSGLQVRIYIVPREVADLVRPKKPRIEHELGRRTLALSALGRVGNGIGVIYMFYDRVKNCSEHNETLSTGTSFWA